MLTFDMQPNFNTFMLRDEHSLHACVVPKALPQVSVGCRSM
jgi:hypothetical protein